MLTVVAILLAVFVLEGPWRIVAVVAVIFIVQNNDRTDVDFLFFNFHSRVWVAILVAIGIGVLLDRLLTGWWRRRRSKSADR